MSQETLLVPNPAYASEFARMQQSGFQPELLRQGLESGLKDPEAMKFWTETLAQIASGAYPVIVFVRPQELIFVPDPLYMGEPDNHITYHGEEVYHAISHREEYPTNRPEELERLAQRAAQLYQQKADGRRIDLWTTGLPKDRWNTLIPDGLAMCRDTWTAILGKSPEVSTGPMYLDPFVRVRDGILTQKLKK